MLPRLLPVLALLTLGTSCAVPPMDAVRDLAAIHTPSAWLARSPAQLTVPPAFYLGDRNASAEGPGLYPVVEHQTLEMAILGRIAAVDVEDPARSIEVSSWMLIELAHDEHPAARIEAAKILARIAGHWILAENARLIPPAEEVDLAAALVAFDRASNRREFQSSLLQLGRAAIPDNLTGIRVLTAMGRKSNQFVFTTGQGDDLVFSAALGIVMQGLEQGGQDPDADVAEICRHWHTLLLPRAQEESTLNPASR